MLYGNRLVVEGFIVSVICYFLYLMDDSNANVATQYVVQRGGVNTVVQDMLAVVNDVESVVLTVSDDEASPVCLSNVFYEEVGRLGE